MYVPIQRVNKSKWLFAVPLNAGHQMDFLYNALRLKPSDLLLSEEKRHCFVTLPATPAYGARLPSRHSPLFQMISKKINKRNNFLRLTTFSVVTCCLSASECLSFCFSVNDLKIQ